MVLHYDIKSILLILLPPNRNGLIKQWLWDCSGLQGMERTTHIMFQLSGTNIRHDRIFY